MLEKTILSPQNTGPSDRGLRSKLEMLLLLLGVSSTGVAMAQNDTILPPRYTQQVKNAAEAHQPRGNMGLSPSDPHPSWTASGGEMHGEKFYDPETNMWYRKAEQVEETWGEEAGKRKKKPKPEKTQTAVAWKHE